MELRLLLLLLPLPLLKMERSFSFPLLRTLNENTPFWHQQLHHTCTGHTMLSVAVNLIRSCNIAECSHSERLFV
ncbi:hypothetical protein RDWZM_001597 [Blomia tropicalis]|uniref:Secreted protein n=1 Tax=Blomia tropicalis TaxID=40697 RepID=A0A9Q0MEQ5_BLOTA|nr:hypothetical protein RDWZM_001597 [Blomia tropicalis]